MDGWWEFRGCGQDIKPFVVFLAAFGQLENIRGVEESRLWVSCGSDSFLRSVGPTGFCFFCFICVWIWMDG